jgi:hypothetical protein
MNLFSAQKLTFILIWYLIFQRLKSYAFLLIIHNELNYSSWIFNKVLHPSHLSASFFDFLNPICFMQNNIIFRTLDKHYENGKQKIPRR